MAVWKPMYDFEGYYYGNFDLSKACIVREKKDENGIGLMSKRKWYIQDLVISKTGRTMIHFHSLITEEENNYCPVPTSFAAKWLDVQNIELDETELYPHMKHHLRAILETEGY